jgi:hypothetical protein
MRPGAREPATRSTPQKSYKDFNDVWPEGSWSISEPSDGYTGRLVRLLSKFVR